MLKFVVGEIGDGEDEEARPQIVVVTRATLDGVCGRTARRSGVIGGVDDVAIEADLVPRRDAGGFSSEIEREKSGIAARFAEAGIQQATPEIGDVGMLQAVVVALLRGV